MVPIIAYLLVGLSRIEMKFKYNFKKVFLNKMFAKNVSLITTHYMLKAAKRKIIKIIR